MTITTGTASTSSSGAGRRLFLHCLPLAALLLAVAALVLLIIGPLGWRAGWWHYRFGLQTLMPFAGYVGLAAAGVAVLALIAAVVWRGPRRGIILAVLGLLIGGTAAYFPWHWSNQRGLYPSFNDITTDLDNPPSLAFSEEARQAENGGSAAYGGPGVAALQKKSYPDIAPAILDLPPAQAFERALAAARGQGWTIVKSDAAAGVIDAYDRSRWFGFTDDIAVRITASGNGSRMDIRSASRQGRGDFGVNAARIRAYLAALHNAVEAK